MDVRCAQYPDDSIPGWRDNFRLLHPPKDFGGFALWAMDDVQGSEINCATLREQGA